MKKIFSLSFLFLFAGLVAHAQWTITTKVCGDASSVRLTGPWWDWNPSGGPAADDNGDGTWTFTFPDAPTDDMEYKLVVNGSMEDLVSGGDFSCTPVTDNATYANRQWTVGSDNVTGITFGTCGSSCDGLVIKGCMDENALNFNSIATQENGTCSYGSSLPINFEGTSYETSAFDGASIELAENPSKSGINASNQVAKVVRNGGQIWAGTILTTKPVDFSEDNVLKIKVYSPKAGTPIQIKYEAGTGESSGTIDKTISVANQWEELSFDFGEEQPADLFTNLVVIFNLGEVGDGSENSTYYFDDIRLSGQTIDNTAPVAETVDVTFQVDMSDVEDINEGGVYVAGGDFGNAGHVMTDNGSGIWSVTLALNKGKTYLYKYRNYTPTNGDDWNGFEDKNPLAADGCTTGQYDDRFVVVGSSNKTLDLVKYGSCDMGVPAVPGCVDENATNYDPAATIAAKDEYNNLLCAYTSCDDIPEWGGCIFSESFGYFENGFNAQNCLDYGGTPCGDLESRPGCINPNATNYDASATTQDTDAYGNQLCVFTSCDVVPQDGCVYADSFGPYVEGFGAEECANYGGTPCVEAPEDIYGCMDSIAINYNADATKPAGGGSFSHCEYASCEDIPVSIGCLYSGSFSHYYETFSPQDCINSGGLTCGPDSIFMIADFENGHNYRDGWDWFFQSGVSFFHLKSKHNAAQGQHYYKMSGEVSWDWLIGMVNIPATAYPDSTFNLNKPADEVYFNAMINVRKPNAELLFQFNEDDNKDGNFSNESEDVYSYHMKNLEPGWQHISIKYSDLPSGYVVEPTGNRIHNPKLLHTIDILLLADPSSGFTQVDLDYMYFSFESTCNEGSGICNREGCTNSLYDNYDPFAAIDDGSCTITACPYPQYFEYNSNYTHGIDTLCKTYIIEGCTYYEADNYNAQANLDDGGCIVEGCMSSSADNYNGMATYQNENSCLIYGCTNSTADNYMLGATYDNGSCIIGGCRLIHFENYNPLATYDDGSCDESSAHKYGCMETSALNYNSSATIDNGSCSWISQTDDSKMDMPQGWSMFGYTCSKSIDVVDVFNDFEDQVIIVKDGDGNVYLPEYGFNGLGSLHFARGYQLKTTQEISNFPLCLADDVNQGQMLSIGDYAHGGIVFYLDESGQHGLVASSVDLDNGSSHPELSHQYGFEWGCYSNNLPGADAQWIGSGLQNSFDISEDCETEYGGVTAAQSALKFDLGGYSDWYLPSIGELSLMSFTIGRRSQKGNLGGFINGHYWSSSEVHEFGAYSTYFGNDTVSNDYYQPIRAYGKSNFFSVRPIRAF